MSNGQSLQGVLDRINLVWPDLLDEDCNPLDIVLPLLNNKSISPTIDEFEELKSQFTRSLQQAVNSNYMAFNDSIGSYGISVETLKQSQDRLSGIKKSMGTIDEMINTPSRILAELNDKRMEHIQTLELLGKINDVKKKLDILQDLIGNRDFSKAGELVNEIMETSNTNRLFEIDALQELQMKLNSNIALLLDGLVTEMNNIIYLKDSTHIEQIQSGSSVKISTHKDLLDFVKCLHNESLEGNEEITAERGNYLTLSKLIKQVQAINKESDCLLKLIEGSEREIKKVIKRCIEEVKKMYPSQIEMNMTLYLNHELDSFSSFNLLRGMNGTIIKEVFERIFSKMLYVLQRHVVIYEISKIDGYRYKLDKVWRDVQKQLSLILFNYVVDENLLNSLEELDLKAGKKKDDSPFKKAPKRIGESETNTMFKFSELSTSSISDSLSIILNRIYRGKSEEDGVLADYSIDSKVDGSIFIGVEDINNSRNILVPPNIFNMAYIIDSFIKFTNDLAVAFSDNRTNDAVDFFNQFMEIVFVSQLENTITYQFDKICENSWKINNLLNASILLQQFFNKMLVVLDTSCYYKKSYVLIIMKLLYKVTDQFKQIKDVLLKTNKTKILKSWIGDSKLKAISNDIVEKLLNNGDMKSLDFLNSKELSYSLSIGGNYVPEIDPCSFLSLEHMRSLVDLLASLSNMLSWLPGLKREATDNADNVGLTRTLNETWTLSVFNDDDLPLSLINLSEEYEDDHTTMVSQYGDNSRIQAFHYLTLDATMSKSFDNLIESMKHLMNEVEILIRYEIRVECIWCMIQMMLKKQWEQDGNESVDIGVDKFCDRIKNISRIFNKVSKNIVNKSKDEVRIRIFGGLEFWIDKLAIFESRRIEVMGKSGWMKMIVNLRVLQQVIKNINNDIDSENIDDERSYTTNLMNNSLRYFAIGSEGESFVLNIDNLLQENLNFTDDDWKNLLRLVFSEKLKKDPAGNTNKKFVAAQARLLKGLAPKQKNEQ